jgi:hypothetical protein
MAQPHLLLCVCSIFLIAPQTLRLEQSLVHMGTTSHNKMSLLDVIGDLVDGKLYQPLPSYRFPSSSFADCIFHLNEFMFRY